MLGEHIVALCQFIHSLLSNRYKLITNVRSSLMAVNIHITIIELNALHTKRQNLFQELDAVIHLLMEAKHWGLRKSRNATSLNSRFKSLDTLKVKIISRSEERFSRNAETDLVCRLLLEKKNEGGPDCVCSTASRQRAIRYRHVFLASRRTRM